MKYLVSGIHAHYKFNPTVRSGDVSNVVYINNLGKHVFDYETAPLDKYGSVKEVLAQYGQLNTFFEYLLSFQKMRLFLSLEVEDNHRFTVGFLRALYPNMSVEQMYRILHLWVRFEKVHITSNRRWPDSLRQAYMDLPLPTQAQVNRYAMQFAGQERLSADLRHLVGLEFLLAHSYAVDFNPSDTYVQACAKRIEKLLWNSLTHDFLQLRKRALLGHQQLGELFNLPIDANHVELDTHLRRVTRSPVFGEVNAISAGEFVQDNLKVVYEFMLKMHRCLGEDAQFTRQRHEVLASLNPLTAQEARRWVEDAPVMAWSRLFVHPISDGFINPSMLDMIQRFSLEELQAFRLDQ